MTLPMHPGWEEHFPAPKGESRSYLVGLPVLITVWDDGTVVYDVDTSEATKSVIDAWYEGDVEEGLMAEVMHADVERVAADHERRQGK